MEIRKATVDDIPEIIAVLKASLGETSSQKTEEVWGYKHVSNPFGESLVLLAVENARVIGVRAFMRWEWQMGEKLFPSFRAVDTATHPDFQGRGIFKKLTLRALEIGQEEGYSFVFNTPNSQSKPGYLKMGWKIVDKLNISLSPVNPLFWKFGINRKNYKYIQHWEEFNEPSYIKIHNSKLALTGKLFTPKSQTYLNWRYRNNPLQEYQVKANNDFFLAGYVKQHGKVRELRISEIITSPGVPFTIIKKEIRSWCRQFGVQVVTAAPIRDLTLPMKVTRRLGPTLTLRKLDLPPEELEEYLYLDSWCYSIGDLELF